MEMEMNAIFTGPAAMFAMGLHNGRLRRYVEGRFEGVEDTKAGAILRSGKEAANERLLVQFSGVGVDNFVTYAQHALDSITDRELISSYDNIDVYIEEEE
mgnify:CR=1 FL=1